MTQVGVRPARPSDAPFLDEVFALTRELDLGALPPDLAERIMGQQRAAQQAGFDARRPAVEDLVLLTPQDGAPCGRLVLQDTADALRVVEIALLPIARGRGLGSAALRLVQDRARAGGKAVELKVTPDNPAAALYARLGFSVVETDGVRLSLRWSAPEGEDRAPIS